MAPQLQKQRHVLNFLSHRKHLAKRKSKLSKNGPCDLFSSRCSAGSPSKHFDIPLSAFLNGSTRKVQSRSKTTCPFHCLFHGESDVTVIASADGTLDLDMRTTYVLIWLMVLDISLQPLLEMIYLTCTDSYVSSVS